jgi:hypothetical protein
VHHEKHDLLVHISQSLNKDNQSFILELENVPFIKYKDPFIGNAKFGEI